MPGLGTISQRLLLPCLLGVRCATPSTRALSTTTAHLQLHTAGSGGAAATMKLRVPEEYLREVGKVLNDPQRPLKERFRALFTLRNIEGGVPHISKCFGDKSALLLHELAYCLGQTKDPAAIPVLVEVLENSGMETIARHEAGEALGALGYDQNMMVLLKYANDSNPVISETCELAVERLQFIKTPEYAALKSELEEVPYKSIDPAPPFPKNTKTLEELAALLLDPKQSLWNRYRAMFTLRNMGTKEAVQILGRALSCRSSALFRHEVAYVFGQMQHEDSIPFLQACLANTQELAMVRHECAEALGSIATDECIATLKSFLTDSEAVVRESCEVALDMCEYENSAEFQYADTLARLGQVHSNCRNSTYPGTQIVRAEVPLDKVSWDVAFADYAPVEYESPSIQHKQWADPKIPSPAFCPIFNDMDGNINRKSHEGAYEVVDGRPRNPHGRTGIAGRGRLGRYGPNHAADPVVTRWKRDQSGQQVFDKTTSMPIAEFVGIQRKDNGQWAIPGGMVDPGETVSTTLRREFMEEAMDQCSPLTGAADAHQRLSLEQLFDQGALVYKGYVDDPRNTDNAWIETVVMNFHDKTGEFVDKWKLRAGSDAGKVRWIPLSRDMQLYATHAKFLGEVAHLIKAHW